MDRYLVDLQTARFMTGPGNRPYKEELVWTWFSRLPKGTGFLWNNQLHIKVSEKAAYNFETRQMKKDWKTGTLVQRVFMDICMTGEYRHPRAFVYRNLEHYTCVSAFHIQYQPTTNISVPKGFLAGTLLPETHLTSACIFRTVDGQFAMALPDGTSFWFTEGGCIRKQDPAALVYPLKAKISMQQNSYDCSRQNQRYG